MCGLVGVAGKLEFSDEALLRRLLWLDYWRGPDSTGFAAVRKTNDVHIAKIASHPADLFDTKKFQDAQSGHNSKAFIGHNRAATKGKVTAVNAHPFQFDHIIGAHNGTLTLRSHNDLEDACGEKFNVDSQALFACIAKIGLKDTVKLLQGAWALTYVDLDDNTLNFIRNGERPLWYSYSADYKKLIWASEYLMIDNACRSQAKPLDLYKDPNKGYKFWEVEVDRHYKWSLDDLASDERVKPRTTEMKGKEPPVVSYANNNGGDPFGRGNGMGQGMTTSGKTTTTTYPSRGIFKKEVSPDQRIIPFLGDTDNPFGGLIDRAKFEDLSKYGCSFCLEEVHWGQTGLTVFESFDGILCPTCSRTEASSNRIYVQNINLFV